MLSDRAKVSSGDLRLRCRSGGWEHAFLVFAQTMKRVVENAAFKIHIGTLIQYFAQTPNAAFDPRFREYLRRCRERKKLEHVPSAAKCFTHISRPPRSMKVSDRV